jgi:hypothetical protein
VPEAEKVEPVGVGPFEACRPVVPDTRTNACSRRFLLWSNHGARIIADASIEDWLSFGSRARKRHDDYWLGHETNRTDGFREGGTQGLRERLALRLLGRIMNWSEETATEEYGWLRLMSRLKYDGYRDYLAGVRFVESLAGWLQQFEPADRATAYDFVRHRLIYISDAEIRRLVELFYPRVVEPMLLRTVAEARGIPAYMVWSDEQATRELQRRRRQTLFMGLSDGARIDVLRRANAGVLTTEQIVLETHLDDQKWENLGENLSEDPLLKGILEPKFSSIYLLDDLNASGTTFIRRTPQWKGKLIKFRDGINNARKSLKDRFPVASRYTVHVHHYIATTQARGNVLKLIDQASNELAAAKWFDAVQVTEGMLLDGGVKLTLPVDSAMLALCDKYYDDSLFQRLRKHAEQAGQRHMRYGYADCALPLVLEHNTPNNAISLLWAETEGSSGPRMVPLFRRRDRHG